MGREYSEPAANGKLMLIVNINTCLLMSMLVSCIRVVRCARNLPVLPPRRYNPLFSARHNNLDATAQVIVFFPPALDSYTPQALLMIGAFSSVIHDYTY